MPTRTRHRWHLTAMIAGAVLGGIAAEVTAQYPPGVGFPGQGSLISPGATFPAAGAATTRGAAPSAPTLYPTSTAAGPRVVIPALTVAPTARLGPLMTQAPAATAPGAPPGALRLTLEDAKQRALANSKLLNIGALNVQSKEYAVKVARADYFPKVTGNVFYFHFNDNLGTVLTGGGRTVSGPRGKPLVTFPPRATEVAVFSQNTTFTNLNATQPLTDLLKVRQGVKIAQADVQIAQAEVEKGIRDLASGVEQLYWGLLAVQRIRAGTLEGLRGAEQLAKTGTLEARTALVEAQQGLQQVDKQLADLQEQMNGLLDLPLCTVLELVEPPLPALPFGCADDVIGLALANSPELRQAQHTIAKAQAAVVAGKLDYVPSIAAVGGGGTWAATGYFLSSKLPSDLVGKWVIQGGPQDGATFDFSRDGSMVARLNNNGNEVLLEARAEVKGKQLLTTTKNPHTGKEETNTSTIRELTRDTLILQTKQGEIFRMTRAE